MDQQFTTYFDDRLREVTEGFQAAVGPDSISIVESAVDLVRGVAADRGTPLRSDAASFLLLSFQEFVSRPMQVVRPDIGPNELSDAIVHDMSAIVARAADLADDRQISMHSIVNATSESWSELRSASWQLWDG
jgi:hypothetical protein